MKKGTHARALVERARWIADFRVTHPTLSYKETLDATRRHFVIGKTAAEQAYSHLKRLEDEHVAEWVARGRERLASVYIRIAEAAERKGDLTNARKSADAMRIMFGIGEAERVDVEHSGAIKTGKYANLTDEELLIMAKLDIETDQSDDE